MTKARTLADMISDGVIGTTELADDVITPVKLDETGNYTMAQLGIGTSSPATSLHLSSAADPVFRIQRGTGSYSEISSDSNGTLFLRADEGNTTSSSNIRFEVDNTEHMRLDEYGQLILQSNPSTLFLGGTSTGSLVKGTSTGNYLIFGTSGSEAARFVGSNFGIGTTSPSRKLEVVDNGDILQITGTAGNAFARFTDNDASSDFSIGADDNSGAGAGAFMVYDRNNNAYRMIINSSGNVGIGVTNPSNKFQVSDSAGGSIASFTNTTSADLSINLTSGVSLISPSTGILALGTSNTERMRIDSAGRVTTPYQPAVYVRKSNGQNITSAGVWTVISYNDVSQQTGSNYSNQTNRFTAPISGWHHISATLNVTANSSASSFSINAFVNGSSTYIGESNMGTSTRQNLTVSGAKYLNSGDYVEIRFRSQSSTAVLDNSGFMSVYLLG